MLSEFAALNRSYDRLRSDLVTQLGRFRVVLVSPRVAAGPRTQAVTQRQAKAGPRIRRPGLKPLAKPDPRLLRRLNPQIQDLVKENRSIEDILTREIVRDVDSKLLDVRRLLGKSGIRISFGIDLQGHVVNKRIETSSGVPSIDHLALELVSLLEKYQLLWILKGFSRILLSIHIEEQAEFQVVCTPAKPRAIDETRSQALGTLALLGIIAEQNDASFLLRDVAVTTGEEGLKLSKTLPKAPLVAFLMQYYLTQTPK